MSPGTPLLALASDSVGQPLIIPLGRFAGTPPFAAGILAHNLLRWIAALGLGVRVLVVAKTVRRTLLGAATQPDPIGAAGDAVPSRDARAALAAARPAWSLWQELDAPYKAASARVVVGMACRSLGDQDAPRMELDTARHLFEGLAAGPDRAQVESLTGRAPSKGGSGLDGPRGGGAAAGRHRRTNRVIAGELFLSEKTVARHVSNIFSSSACPRGPRPRLTPTSTTF
jgi:hypothetical protein